MEFSAKTLDVTTHKCDCLVLGVVDGRKQLPATEAYDKAHNGAIGALVKRGDLDPQPGQTLLVSAPDGAAANRLLLVGLGKSKDIKPRTLSQAATAVAGLMQRIKAKDLVLTLGEAPASSLQLGGRLQLIASILGNSDYRPDVLKSKKDDKAKAPGKVIFALSEGDDEAAAKQAVKAGAAIAEGMKLTRELGDLAPNVCTPTYLAERALELAKAYKSLKVEVLEQADMEKLGMGSLLGVSRGSRQPPKLITIQYNGGKKKDKPAVLVGKGITFDAGGISLKPGEAMDEMKYDMCGAASVFGAMKTVAELGLKQNVVGVIPTCENLPDGNATKPGDILTSMSGLTIEVLNTDAEGRLILCDALTYSAKFEPDTVIDIATLTGACIIALGHHPHGLLGNDQALVDEILKAGIDANDRAWQLPLWEEYQEQLKSNFADLQNIGGRPAGTVTAACFLSRFAEDYRWAHLDIAGTAWKSGKEKGATGRPVPLLVQYLLNRENHG